MTKIPLVILGALTVALAGCRGPSEELRYRLTVEVQTPQGLRTGSSVIEVHGVKNPGWVNIEGRGTRSSFKGEAVAVDLPSGNTLFALLRTDGGASDAADYPWLAFRDLLHNSPDWLESMRRLRQWKGQVRPMPSTEKTIPDGGQIVSSLPLVVTFRDLNEPTSISRVDANDLAATFGSGYSLKVISVGVTNDPVTIGIDKKLKWLPSVYERLKGVSFKPVGIPVGDFKRLFTTELR